MRFQADTFSSADTMGMSLDPLATEPPNSEEPSGSGHQPATDGQDPASSGGPAPYNGADPFSQPVTEDPMWRDPSDRTPKPPYTSTPYTGPGPGVNTTTLHNAQRGPMEETMSITDLWTEASRDVEAEQETERMLMAKVATSSLWPFLSAAASEQEFGHRLALCEDRLEALFPDDDFRTTVTASLHEDYLTFLGQDPVGDALRTKAAQDPDEAPHGAGGQGPLSNPAYADTTPEAGPNTGSDGQFPQFPAGPDPWNPMNAQYPAQPGQWTVPPDATWVERPMSGMIRGGSAGHPDHATHYRGEGVETGPAGTANPDYFAGGGEGVAGDQQTGFPADVSLPEADERVDYYGTVPPQVSGGSAKSARYVVAEKDNHGACVHCNSPVYRHGGEWKHLGGDPGHGVRLHEDHPWVQSQFDNRHAAVQHTAPGGGTHSPYRIEKHDDGFYVVNDKGERKNDDPHASYDEARQHQKALYRNVPGAAEKAAHKVAHWVIAEMGDPADTAAAPDPTAAPPTPGSMDGGAGSTAMPPLTIPNDQAATNPLAGTGPGPAASGGMPGMNNPFLAASTVRQRPGEYSGEVPDEYEANTWEGPAKTRPQQGAEDRGVNTPQQPDAPLPTLGSEPSEQAEQEQEDRR